MSLFVQVLVGSSLLVLSAIIHVSGVAASIPVLRWLAAHMQFSILFRTIVVLSACIMGLLAAHSVQIWIWAALFYRLGHFEDLTTALYFSTVTYTTLGYGDIVLGEEIRLVSTFAAVAGLMAFGISTAFLIGVLSRLLPEVFRGEESS